MAAQAYLDQVQNAYIAYYGRPADPEGQLYWANKLEAVGGNLTALVNEFGNSAEFNAFAAGKSNSTLIDQLYLNLFNRSADVSGLSWYVGELLAGRKTLATIALDVLNGATGVDTATLASKFQASNAFTAAIDTPTERDSYNANTINSVKDWLKGINTPTAASTAVSSINTNLPTILQAGAASNPMEFILTTGSDINKQANIFTASPDFTPAGNYRENTLQDEDVLIGVNTNQASPATLNATLSNNSGVAAAAGSNTISPKMTDIRILNIAFTGSGAAAVNQLDLQDSSGYTDVNITRINDGVSINDGDGFMEAGERAASIDSMRFIPTNLSVANTGQDRPHVEFTFTDAGAAGANDATKISLKNANIGRLVIEENAADGTLNQGIETLTLDSSVSANSAQTMAAQDLVTLLITGSQNLSLGGRANVTGAQGNEATHYDAGLSNVAGSLNTVNASVFSGALDYTIGTEINAGQNGTSGVNVNLQVTGGSNNDTFRLIANSSVDAKDVISGGAGTNTLVMFGGNSQLTADVSATNTVTPNLKSIQSLEIRTGHDAFLLADAVTVNANAFDSLATIYVRNEGQQQIAGAWVSGAEAMTVNLNNLTSTQANAITLAHGTTGNSNIANNLLNIGLSDTTGVADTATLTLVDGTNADSVFNADVDTLGVENMTIIDRDSESNSLHLNPNIAVTGAAGVAFQTGSKLTLTGGLAGTYTNLDTSFNALGAISAAAVANATNGYGYDTTGATGDTTTAMTATAPNNRDTTVSTVFKDNGLITGNLTNVETLEASTYASDIIARFGEITRANGVSSQAITTGTGSDSLIFDKTGTTNAGYTSGDTVKAGTGSDTLIIDGQHTARIAIQKSEWDNTTGIDTLRLAGNAGVANVGNNAIVAATDTSGGYYIEIDNEFVRQSDAQNGLNIINNDGDLSTNSESDLILNLRDLTQSSNVKFTGASGNGLALTPNASNRVQVTDNSANGLNTLEGGDTIINEVISTGNNNVLQVFNTAQLSINDFANVKNFGRIEATNDTTTAQTLTVQLNSTVMDQLVDSTSVASTTNVERLVIVANNSTTVAGAVANLDIDASSVGTAFGLDVIAARGTVNTIKGTLGNDKVVLLGNYTAAEQLADAHAVTTLFNAASETANMLTGAPLTTALPSNDKSYKGADGIFGTVDDSRGADGIAGNADDVLGADGLAGTADDGLLAYTGSTFALGTGDTIEVFGGVDLTGATITAGTNFIAHSALRLTEAQMNSIGTITFVGATGVADTVGHALRIVDTVGVTAATLNNTSVASSAGKLTVFLETNATGTAAVTGTVGIQANAPTVNIVNATTGATTNTGGTVTLTAAPTTINEGSSVTYTIANAAPGNTYDIAVGGTGITTADYTASATQVTIGSDGTKTFSVSALSDATTEGAETMVVTATKTGTTSGISQSIVINDTSNALGTSTLTTSAASVNENSAVTYTLSNVAAGSYAIAVSGTGVTTTDYTLSTQTLVIPTGSTSGSFTITALADSQTEGTEAMTVTVAGLSQSVAINDTSMATGTTTLTPAATTVNEGTAVNYTLTNIAAGTYNVVVSGTGITAADYSTPSTIVIPTGSTSGSLTITALADLATEGNEGMIVTVNGIASTPVTINDTSVGPILTTTATSVNEGGALTYTLSNTAPGTYNIAGTTGAGTATSGTDYNIVAPATITIPTGSTSGTFTVNVVADALTEATAEAMTFTATLQGASTPIATSTAVTINDTSLTPTTPTLTTTAASVNEGSSLTYTLSNVVAGTVYTLGATGSGAGIATPTADYTFADSVSDAVITTVTALAGTTSVTFKVKAVADTTTEATAETMTITATAAGSAAVASTAVTINDTSPTPAAGVTNPVAISSDGTTAATAANDVFNIAATATYTNTITGFDVTKDKLSLGTGITAAAINIVNDADDSFASFTYTPDNGAKIVTIILTGLTSAQDISLTTVDGWNAILA